MWRLVHQWSFFAVLTVSWLFLTIGVPIVTCLPRLYKQCTNRQKQSIQQKWPLVYQSSHVYWDCTNSVPMLKTVKNSQKTVKTAKMIIGVPIVTCLLRVCRIHKVRVRVWGILKALFIFFHHCDGLSFFRVTTLQTMWNSLTIPWRFAALLRGTRHVKCYSYHARTSVTISGRGRNATVHDPKPYTQHLGHNRLLLNTCMDTNMQFTINSFRQLYPDKICSLIIPIFSKISDISLTAVKFPNISMFPDKSSPWFWRFWTLLCL